MPEPGTTACTQSSAQHPNLPVKVAEGILERKTEAAGSIAAAMPSGAQKESELSDNGQHKLLEASAARDRERPSDTELDSSKKQKADTDDVYDSSKNFFSSVVSKAKRAISKLSTEEHVLTTLTAEQNPSERKIKQTHEMKRCFDAVAFAKQKIVDCIKICHEAQGHRQVPQDHFTEEEELPVEHIKCSACDNGESEEDNDILLCDGEGCNRCYHVQCVPFRSDLDLQALLDDEESGWLCPACDAKYDIFWHLSETRDMNYNSLLGLQAEDVFAGDDLTIRPASPRGAEKDNVDKRTILHAELPSSDEEDSDFAGSDLEEEPHESGEAKAGPSPKLEQSSRHVDDDDEDEQSDEDAGDSEEGEGEDSGGNSSDEYIDDEDDASLDARDNDADMQCVAGPSGHAGDTGEDPREVVAGKRRRTPVDYAVLNSYLFGAEQDEDQEDAEYAADAVAEDSDDDMACKGPKRSKKRRTAALK
eukprot:jgi/Ulvmu1/11539/UM078_0029.1